MNKRIRIGALSALLAVGSVGGVALLAGVANAQTDDTTTTTEVATTGEATTGETTPTEHQERREERRAARQADRQAVADLLGVELDDLKEQLQAGATLAEIAEANGVEVSAVVDLIVEQKTARIDQAVENGKLTAERAAELKAELPELVETRVNEGRPDRGEGGHHRGHGRRGAEVAEG